jgi:hypothetical protein
MNRSYAIGIGVAIVVILGVVLFLNRNRVFGDEAKQVTISGDLVCAHCRLHASPTCGVALKASEGNYFLVKNEESDKVFDKRDKGLKVNVTGTVEEKDGKKWITASKIELEEK